MKKFNSAEELVAGYAVEFNSGYSCPDKHFTTDEIAKHHLSTIMRQALKMKYGITITGKQAHIIRNFGYAEM